MKKSLLLLTLASFFAIGINAQFGFSTHTLSTSSGLIAKNTQTSNNTKFLSEQMEAKPDASDRLPNNNPSVQFGGDVVIKTDITNQRNVKVATAFNGWIYSACTIYSAGNSGVQIRRSKDGGITWTDFVAGVLNAGVNYSAVDIAVAGTDTVNLYVFIAGIVYVQSSGSTIAWADKYQGANGNFLGENFNESNTGGTLYDIAIATDYRHPSYLSGPFSVGIVYSKNAPYDSIIYLSSIDAGATYTTRIGAYKTGGFCGKVAIAFGIGANFSNGRYFLAFESKALPGDNVGHVVFTHTSIDPTSGFDPPVFLDSVGVSPLLMGRLGHPRIACSNDGLDNDSGNIAALVFVDRNYGGGDYDVLGFYSNISVHSVMANWHVSDISNNGNYATGGDVAYNEMSRTFCGTYFDSTSNVLLADSTGLNISSSTSWTYLTGMYNDNLTNVIRPYPRVSINPVSGTPNFVWNSEGVSIGISLFDAMNNPNGIPVASSTYDFDSPYPNPSNGTVNFNYTLRSNESIQLSVINLLGQEVIQTMDFGTQVAGEYHVPMNFSNLPNGVYVYRFVAGKEMRTGNIVIAH